MFNPQRVHIRTQSKAARFPLKGFCAECMQYFAHCVLALILRCSVSSGSPYLAKLGLRVRPQMQQAMNTAVRLLGRHAHRCKALP